MARARKRQKPKKAPGILDAQDDVTQPKDEGVVGKAVEEAESTKTIKGVKEVEAKGKEDENKVIIEKASVEKGNKEEVSEFRDSWRGDEKRSLIKYIRRKGNKQKEKVEEEDEKGHDNSGKKEDFDKERDEEKDGSNRREPTSEENVEKEVKEGNRRNPSRGSKISKSEETVEKEAEEGNKRNPSRGSNIPKRFGEFESDNATKKRKLTEVRKAFRFVFSF